MPLPVDDDEPPRARSPRLGADADDFAAAASAASDAAALLLRADDVPPPPPPPFCCDCDDDEDALFECCCSFLRLSHAVQNQSPSGAFGSGGVQQ